jgi:hypothetical protein
MITPDRQPDYALMHIQSMHKRIEQDNPMLSAHEKKPAREAGFI